MLRRLLTSTALAFSGAVFVVLGLLPHLGWYRTVTVLSGSMRPSFAPGDLLVVTSQSGRDVRAGQVIVYSIPIGDRHVEAHRVVRVVRPGDEPVVRTRGDANDHDDPWLAQLHGRVWVKRAVVPKAGWPILWFRNPPVHRAALFGAPLSLSLFGLLGIWAGSPVPKRREDESPGADREVAVSAVVPERTSKPAPTQSASAGTIAIALLVGVWLVSRRRHAAA